MATSSSAIDWLEIDPRRSMSVAQRVAAALPHLRSSERRVATHLAANSLEVVGQSALSLAESAGVSDASVLRTSRALGYGSFSELKEAMRNDIARFMTTGHAAPERGDLSDELNEARVAALRLTEEMYRRLSTRDIEQAVSILVNAPTALTFGIGLSAPIADYLARLLSRASLDARDISSSGFAFADLVTQVRKNSAVVLIAPGAFYPEMDALLDRAEEVDASVILITDTLTPLLEQRITMSFWAPFPAHGPLRQMLTVSQICDLVADAVRQRLSERAESHRDDIDRMRSRVVATP